jgi:hypothetical protein
MNGTMQGITIPSDIDDYKKLRLYNAPSAKNKLILHYRCTYSEPDDLSSLTRSQLLGAINGNKLGEAIADTTSTDDFKCLPFDSPDGNIIHTNTRLLFIPSERFTLADGFYELFAGNNQARTYYKTLDETIQAYKEMPMNKASYILHYYFPNVDSVVSKMIYIPLSILELPLDISR